MTMKQSIAGAGHAGLFNATLPELTTLAIEQTQPPQMQDGFKGEMPCLGLMVNLNLADRKNQGRIEMTRPGTPSSRLQKYRRRAAQ